MHQIHLFLFFSFSFVSRTLWELFFLFFFFFSFSFFFFFFTARRVERQSKKRPNQPVMLGRENGLWRLLPWGTVRKIEKREPWEQWAPGAHDIHAKQARSCWLCRFEKSARCTCNCKIGGNTAENEGNVAELLTIFDRSWQHLATWCLDCAAALPDAALPCVFWCPFDYSFCSCTSIRKPGGHCQRSEETIRFSDDA